MKIDCVGCLHGCRPELNGGDLLIITGDITANDTLKQWSEFFSWLKKQDYQKKILIAGNHDNFLRNGFPNNQVEADELKEVQFFLYEIEDFEYLCDSGTEFEGMKIWGSPWSLWFKGINPHCKAFTGTENDLKKKYALIPDDTEILITHGPPFGMMDGIPDMYDGSYFHVGSKSLDNKLLELKKIKLHVFSHIHEGYGTCYAAYSTTGPFDANPIPIGHLSVNCSYMNANYKDGENPPIRVIL